MVCSMGRDAPNLLIINACAFGSQSVIKLCQFWRTPAGHPQGAGADPGAARRSGRTTQRAISYYETEADFRRRRPSSTSPGATHLHDELLGVKTAQGPAH